jgi:hypothetical protein
MALVRQGKKEKEGKQSAVRFSQVLIADGI